MVKIKEGDDFNCRNILNISRIKIDGLVKSQKAPVIVIPVKTGIQEIQLLMDSRSPIGVEDKLRGVTALETFYDFVKI